RREAAEALAKDSQPQTLRQYLEAGHALSLAIQTVTDPTSTTQGEPTKPTGRIYPQRIVPWDDFVVEQEAVWDRLGDGRSFCSQLNFPSATQLDYVRSMLYPISSDTALRDLERD
ncbi:hypothetical protein JX266_014548, partial [Neoarthrinium moseri]